MRILPYSLQRRFLVGMLCILVITGTIFALSLRSQMKRLYLSEARAKAGLMVAHTEAIQDYVRKVLRPTMAEHIGMNEFVIEIMSSSYVSRRIMGSLNMEDKDFTYRRVAKNARNPTYEATESEFSFFKKFAAFPDSTRQETFVTIGAREHLVVARPVYFDASCMRCHGKPADAPAVLLAMYGETRGFGRQPGSLAGLDIISVPIENATGAVSKSVTVFALSFLGGMLVLFLLVQGFFNRLVVHNLRRVGHILHQKFSHEENLVVLEPLRREEEIEGMIRSIEAVASHLSDARRQLSDYTKNLEGMVRERTGDLEIAVEARSADVQLFVRLLSGLNAAQEKKALLKGTLRLIASHFSASRAVYVCGMAGSEEYIAWPSEAEQLDRTEQEYLEELLASGTPTAHDRAWYIPVQTRGVLALYWNGHKAGVPDSGHDRANHASAREAPIPSQAHFPLAMALGQQLGIALDNFDALDAVLRQNTLLDSIVDGVNDPLVLVEGGMSPVLANAPARELATRLTAEVREAASPTLHDLNLARIASLLALMGIARRTPVHTTPAHNEVSLPDGSSFAVSVHPLSPVGSGGPRAVIHLRETTEEKRILTQMRQTDKLAAVGQLAAGLAHEINNPLGVIRCYAELMTESVGDEQSRADLGVILRHVDQAQSVLRDMLNFSRARESNPCLCDINEQMQALGEIFRPQAKSARVDLRLETGSDIPPIRLDRRMLEQVVVNLLLNALDAAQRCQPAGAGLICLTTRHDPATGHTVITVRDNGPGISENVRAHMYDPFFTTKEPRRGTGLGLTIAFGMVGEMGGKLDAESPLFADEPGRGTAFHITLPSPPAPV